MSQKMQVRRDTSSWVFQVWASFVIAVIFCGYGVLNLPLDGIYRVFLATGMFFTLFSSFALAKTIRDNQYQVVDTPMWRLQVWVAFAVSVYLTLWGMYTMKMSDWQIGYMMGSGLFLISATFTLSKTIRDGYDADKLEKAGQEVAVSLDKN